MLLGGTAELWSAIGAVVAVARLGSVVDLSTQDVLLLW